MRMYKITEAGILAVEFSAPVELFKYGTRKTDLPCLMNRLSSVISVSRENMRIKNFCRHFVEQYAILLLRC